MKKKFYYLLGIFVLLFVLAFIKIPQANAFLIEGGGGSGGTTRLCIKASNSGTNWQTRLDYYDGSARKHYYPLLWSGSSGTEYCYSPGTPYDSVNDSLQWFTACVDPVVEVSAHSDVGCKSYNANDGGICFNPPGSGSTSCGLAYGACGGPITYTYNDYGRLVNAGPRGSNSSFAINLGSRSIDTLCPIPNMYPGRRDDTNENLFRCVFGGYTSSGVDYVGCAGTSTYTYCGSQSSNNLAGGTGVFRRNPNDSRCPVACTPRVDEQQPYCGINDKCGTGFPNGCGTGTITCGGCSTGYYCANSGGGNGVCTASTTRDLIVTAFTFPGGTAGTAQINPPTITIQNQGNTDITETFNVKIETKQNGTGTSQTVSVAGLNSGSSNSKSPTLSTMTLPAAGSYTAIATVDSGSVVAESNEGNNTATDAYTTTAPATSSITINVYNDFNSNGALDCVNPNKTYPSCTNSNPETPYDSGTKNILAVTGNGSGSSPYTTNTNGQRILSGLAAGSSNITLNPPNGFTSTTLNPRNNISVPGDKTVSFGMHPPGPTCTALTVNPTTSVTASGQTRTLTATCTSPSGSALTYNWNAGTGTVPATSNNDSVTWTATAATMGISNETVGAQACDNVSGVCSNSVQATIPIGALYSISGDVYVDVNKNGIKNGGETNYTTGAITVTRNPVSGSSPTYSNGQYTINNLPAGNYTIAYQGPPSGYSMTYPLVVPPAFTVTVGPGCNDGGSIEPTNCNASGSITNLNFGINSGEPWIQTGADVFFNNGVINIIPNSASCGGNGRVMSIPSNGNQSPGIIFSGDNTPQFGQGNASSVNWQVGENPYPEIYNPKSSGIKTAYAYVSGVLSQNGASAKDVTTVGNCAGSPPVCGTGSSGWQNLVNGVYIANGGLTLRSNANTYTFPANKNFVFLIKGDLYINEKIHVPVGSTVLFSVSGDIYVDSSVGSAFNSYPLVGAADLEGWYSADGSFIVNGSHVCNANPDLRLNMQGAIVVDADSNGSGTFDYSARDLCNGNLTCPVFYIEQRPDFVLNAPPFIQTAPRIWQEVAP